MKNCTLFLFGLFILAVNSASAQDVYLDRFTTTAYNINDGTKNFSTDWIESDGTGGGAASGYISATTSRLVFHRLNSADNIYRRLNLNGVTKQVTLSFDFNATTRGGERLVVQLWNSSTASWQTITTIQTNTTGTVEYTLTANQKSNQSGIRFNTNSGDWDNGDYIYIDNVSFRVEDQPPVITATGNQQYCPGTSIPVVQSISISDPDDSTITEVSVQIASGYVNGTDLLTLTGTHPTISASWLPAEGRILLSGPATPAAFQTAVAAIRYSSSAPNPTGTRNFSLLVGDAYFLPSTGHYYQFFSEVGITWSSARDKAALLTYYGLQGYLATLTSAQESNFAGSQISGAGWIGGSDEAVEGVWRWVTGPEAGINFWNGNAAGSSPNYAFWNTGEPNQSGNEDYAHITEDGTGIDGSWNDLSNTGAASGAYQPKGYVVEFGGTTGDPTINVSASTTINIISLPNITTQPSDQAATTGGSATFSVAATGTGLSYQWQVSTNGGASYTNISGATGTSYTVNPVSMADNGKMYRVLVAASGCSPVISNAAELVVLVDSDNDGVPDVYDLDDDNDGILDSVELASCAGTLGYEFYDLAPSGSTVDNIPTTGALATGAATSFDVDALQNSVDPGDTDNFSIRYTGLISITTAGSYTFYTSSDDGSKLMINGLQVVNNDGPHGVVEQSGTIALTAGLHEFETLFFEIGGGESLLVQYAGPGISKQAVPFSVFYQTTCDQDGDGLANHLDPDSDADGCNDADEAYANASADVDNNGYYGSGNPAVNANGTVQAASYQTPADGNSTVTYDFLEAGLAPVITLQPVNTAICPGGGTSFTIGASNANRYQWQRFNGSIWVNLTDTGIYNGSDTATLTISNAALSDNGRQFRVLVSNSGYICSSATSSTATLTAAEPTANAGSDQSICDGQSATLSASASGGSGSGYTYLWSTGQTTPVITVTPTGSPSGNVIVNYTVTVTDSNGCSDPDVVQVTVRPTPTITVTTAPACNFSLFSTTYTLQVTVSSGTVTSTAGTVTNPSTNVWRIASVPNGTNIVLTATAGTCSRTFPVTAPNCICPVVNAPTSTGDKEFCQGSPVPALSVTVGANQAVDWYSASSGGTLLLSGNTSFTPGTAGNYYAQARSTTTGCISSSRTLVRAIQNSLPVANAGPDRQICDGDSATLNGSASGGSGTGYTYLWNTGQSTPTINVSPAGVPNSNTTVIYTLTVTDSKGCANTDTVSVLVWSRPVATVTVNPATCGVSNGSFIFNFPDHPNRTMLQFSLDGGTTYQASIADNTGSISYLGQAPGTYNLTARWGDSFCSVSLGSHTINAIPAVMILSQPSDQTVFVNETSIFTASVNNADTFQWQLSTDGGAGFVNLTDNSTYSGTQTTLLTVNVVEAAFNGYLYRLIASNSATGCSAMSTNNALLMVRVRSVISNKRVTYRINKN